MINCCICWLSCIFLLGVLIFKGLTARRLYKSFGVKGLSTSIIAFCIIIYIPGQRSSSFILSYNLFENLSIVDGTTRNIILAVFSCYILISSSLLKLLGDGAVKVVTVWKWYLLSKILLWFCQVQIWSTGMGSSINYYYYYYYHHHHNRDNNACSVWQHCLWSLKYMCTYGSLTRFASANLVSLSAACIYSPLFRVVIRLTQRLTTNFNLILATRDLQITRGHSR
jgi:hypothetical protein